MRVLTILALLIAAAAAPAQQAARDPDRLYADRENLTSALEAAAIWEARLSKDKADFEAAWKLARACYWLGGVTAEPMCGIACAAMLPAMVVAMLFRVEHYASLSAATAG